MTRKALSKRVRFEVFKRDGFVCQYCGAHPPETVLHVDHVVPVAEGGENNMDNLVTACDACNLGKGARSLSAVPKSLKEKSEEIAEREEQLRGYQEIIQAKRDRLDDESWDVAEILKPGCSDKGFRIDWRQSIVRFVDQIGVHEVIDAAHIAKAKFYYSDNKAFRYFCGICWRKVRGE